jgi:hypothetical protein
MTQRDLDERMQEQRVVLQRYVQEAQTLQAQRLEDFMEQAITRALRGESALIASTDDHLASLKADLVELRVSLEEARRDLEAVKVDVKDSAIESSGQLEALVRAVTAQQEEHLQLQAGFDEMRHKVSEGFKGSLTQQLQLKGALERQQAQLSSDRHVESECMRLSLELQELRRDVELQRAELQGAAQKEQQQFALQQQQEQQHRDQLAAARAEQSLSIEAIRGQHDLAVKAMESQSEQQRDLQESQNRLRGQLLEGFADGQAKLAQVQARLEERSQEAWRQADAERIQLRDKWDEQLARFRDNVQSEHADLRSRLSELGEVAQKDFRTLTEVLTHQEQQQKKSQEEAADALKAGLEEAGRRADALSAEQQTQAGLLDDLQSLEELMVRHLGDLKQERQQEAVRYNEEVVELHRRCEELARSQAEHGSRAELLATLDKLGELTTLVLAERRERVRSHEELEEWRQKSFGAVSQAVAEVREAAESVVIGRRALAREARDASAKQMKSLGQIKEVVEAERQERLQGSQAADTRDLQQWFRQLGMAP